MIQAVILNKITKEAYNYFTHIEFKQTYHNCENTRFLTAKPMKINGNYQLALTRYVITVDNFMKLYLSAPETQEWTYQDEKITSNVILDNVFPTEKKYIPSIDPTGGQYNLVIPFEQSLYGSNFIGNYYVCELYSLNTKITSILSKNDFEKVQELFKEHKLNYNLTKLKDRVGNVICKFNVEIINVVPILLGAQRNFV